MDLPWQWPGTLGLQSQCPTCTNVRNVRRVLVHPEPREPERSRKERRASALSVGPVVAMTLAGSRRSRKLRSSCTALASPTRTVNPGTGEWVVPEDFPKPKGIEETANYVEAKALSEKLKALNGQAKAKTVVVIGGGLSGLACGKYLSDAGHKAVVLEARDVLGGKVSAWQDEDGDWIETGLHIFFGAYPNMMNLFSELEIEDRLQWKRHQMTFAMQELPGEFTTFEFPGWPAPLNMAAAILLNQKMLSPVEKLQTGPPLLPMLIEGQSFIDAQDESSVTEFCRKYGMPERIIEEVFIPMAKALDFIDPDKLSMTVVLTAMNRFINETDGSQTAFLDGNQPDRLCKPMKEHIEARGGEVRLGAIVEEIVLDETNQRNEATAVRHLRLRGGEILQADEYVSALPVDVFKRLIPAAWSTMPFFRQLDNLEGIPVINIHLWFDRKLKNIDALCFSRSPLLSVYADMSTCCKEYHDSERSMLELVFAPCAAIAGSSVNWIAKSDEEIVEATMKELERLFPTEIGENLPDGARLRKSRVVKVPRSVYAAVPGRNKFRPSQATPISNFTLAGDWTSQKFLGSMEGAVLAGKLAAQVVAEGAIGKAHQVKTVPDFIQEEPAKAPVGLHGSTAVVFGGGAELKEQHLEELQKQDPAALQD